MTKAKSLGTPKKVIFKIWFKTSQKYIKFSLFHCPTHRFTINYRWKLEFHYIESFIKVYQIYSWIISESKMVVKVEAEPAEVTASYFLNINLTVSPPATSIYFFQLYISIKRLHRFQAKKGFWYLSPKTGWSRNTLAKLVESFIPYIAAEAVFRFPKISWQTIYCHSVSECTQGIYCCSLYTPCKNTLVQWVKENLFFACQKSIFIVSNNEVT